MAPIWEALTTAAGLFWRAFCALGLGYRCAVLLCDLRGCSDSDLWVLMNGSARA